MNRKKTLAIVLAAIMTVSAASTSFAVPAVGNTPVAYQYTVSDGVAVVNSAEGLKEALQGSESVIRLDENITASITVESGRTVELDLAGRTLTNADGSHTITVKGVLTVTDSVGGGVVDNVTHERAAIWNEGSTALEGGKFTRSQENGQSTEDSGGNSYYVLVNHNRMEIYDGVTVRQDGNYSSMIENGWYNGNQNTSGKESVMEIHGGTFTGGLNTVKNDDYGNLTIYGGTFSNVTQSAVLNWNKTVIKGGEFSSSGTNGDPVILNGKLDDTMDQGKLVIEGGQFRSENPEVKVIGKMSGSTGSEFAQISGGVFYNPVASENYEKVEVDEQAAQAIVEPQGENGVVRRIGADATSFEVQEGDIVRVKKLPAGRSMELYGDTGMVTVFNDTGDTIVVNGTQVKYEAGTDNGVQVPVISDVPEREERESTGDYFGNEKWAAVKREIAAADEGDTIKVSATGLPWFPSSVARALKGRDITLEVRKNGVTYSINGLEIGAIEKIWYEFDQIDTELLTVEAE